MSQADKKSDRVPSLVQIFTRPPRSILPREVKYLDRTCRRKIRVTGQRIEGGAIKCLQNREGGVMVAALNTEKST